MPFIVERRFAPPWTNLLSTIAPYGWARYARSGANGSLSTILTVMGSITSTRWTPFRFPRSDAPVFGSRMRSSENLTSAAVSGSPLWNFTPDRRWNTICVCPTIPHRSARAGSIAAPCPYRTSPSYTDSLMYPACTPESTWGSRSGGSAEIP